MKIKFRFILVIKTAIRVIRVLCTLLRHPHSIRFAHPWIVSLLPGHNALSDQVPWVTFEARSWLESYLKPNMFVFEYGSGGSTIFVSKRVNKLISIEHDKVWHSKVSRVLLKEGISNCECTLCEPEKNISGEMVNYGLKSCTSEIKGYEGMSFEKYVKIIDKYPDESFDLVVIDGMARASCISHAMGKIRPGGYLLLDNSDTQRYDSAMSLLAGYKRTDFFGVGPCLTYLWQTSVWEKKSVGE